jgi:hypothetical protein
MPVTVQGPDGKTYQFPDGTDKTAAIDYFKKKGIGIKAPSQPGAQPAEKSFTDKLTEIQPHQPVHSASDLGREFVRGVGNMGAGALGVVLHPVDTVTGAAKFAWDVTDPRYLATGKTDAPEIHALDESIKNQPLEIAESMAGQTAVSAGAGEAVPKFKGAMTKTLEATRRGTQGLVGAGERPVKAATLKAGEEAKTADVGHLEKTQEALHETRGRELKHGQDTKAARETAEREGKEATAKQIADRNKTVQERQAAEEKLKSDKAKQAKIAPTQSKLQTAWGNLRAGIETARAKALDIGNKKYNAVNPSLNPIEANPEFMQGALADATESIKGTSAEPTILKDMGRKLQHGDVPTYEDLQGYYSELGSEISKGSLPGDLYHAYDTLHEAIGDEMQRIADAEGKGAELTDARNYWRRMKQAFGKPFNATDAATKALDAAAPDLATAEEQANRVRLIGSFDPDIPKLFSHVENIQKGVDALPSPVPERVLTEKAKIPTVPERGRPVTVEPKPVAPVERAPIPDRPETVDVNTREVRQKLLDKWATGESSLSKFQVSRLLGSTVFGTLIGTIFGHGVGAGVGSAAGAMSYALTPAIVARILERPAVAEWLTRPPSGELEALRKLPNADRIKITDGLEKVVKQAQNQGIKVSPLVIGALGALGFKGSKTQQLEKTRAAQQSEPTE